MGSASDTNEKRQILVADDDPAILRLVSAILEKENYGVTTARDGREAYKILQSNADFTAAIFDVVMPHISGPELVRYMKTEKRLMNIPVMMMTAEQDPKLSSDSCAVVKGLGRKTTAPAAKLSDESLGSCSAVIIITGIFISRFSVFM